MNKDNNENLPKSSEKPLGISVLYNSGHLSFVYKKTERISCAIYLVTNHLSDREPLKWQVREASIVLVKDILILKNNFSDNLGPRKELSFQVMELTSYLDILKTVGLVSEMNYRVLRGEIVKLSEFIGSNSSLKNSPASDFGNEFFNVPRYMLSAEETSRETLQREEEKEEVDKYALQRKTLSKDISKRQNKGQVSKGHMSFRNVKDNVIVAKESGDTGLGRKELILKFVREKHEVSIKDISSVIKDFSEKTIQRDLLTLVKAGVLKKTGERRWSKYSIA